MTRYDVHPTDEFSWLERRIRRVLGVDAIGFEATDSHGEVVAMCAFEWWSANAVGVHVAADRPLGLRVAWDMMRWALEQRATVWGIVEADGKSDRLARRLGFKERGRLPGAGDNRNDLVLLALSRDDFTERKSHVLRQRTSDA